MIDVNFKTMDLYSENPTFQMFEITPSVYEVTEFNVSLAPSITIDVNENKLIRRLTKQTTKNQSIKA